MRNKVIKAAIIHNKIIESIANALVYFIVSHFTETLVIAMLSMISFCVIAALVRKSTVHLTTFHIFILLIIINKQPII